MSIRHPEANIGLVRIAQAPCHRAGIESAIYLIAFCAVATCATGGFGLEDKGVQLRTVFVRCTISAQQVGHIEDALGYIHQFQAFVHGGFAQAVVGLFLGQALALH